MEMKKFLESNGVCLSAFENKLKRSKTVILAKNLPADTHVSDLQPLFSKFGPLGRIILPPSGVTALIEFCDPSEARQAFKKLAYSKFKNVPLYLEWAPENVFSSSSKEIIPKAEDKTEQNPKDNSKIENNTTEEDERDDNNNNEPPEPNTTLFLRNLNLKTVAETIQNHFKHLGAIHTVEIAKRKDPENPKQMVSLGYGFIQFKKTRTTEQALKNMQFTNIDGNQVELKRSDRILK